MLSCKDLTELTTDYLEGDLPWHVRLRVQLHLWMCRHCRRYLDQMRQVIRLLGRLAHGAAPPKLVETLLAQFRETRDKRG